MRSKASYGSVSASHVASSRSSKTNSRAAKRMGLFNNKTTRDLRAQTENADLLSRYATPSSQIYLSFNGSTVEACQEEKGIWRCAPPSPGARGHRLVSPWQLPPQGGFVSSPHIGQAHWQFDLRNRKPQTVLQIAPGVRLWNTLHTRNTEENVIDSKHTDSVLGLNFFSLQTKDKRQKLLAEDRNCCRTQDRNPALSSERNHETGVLI
jgi:hypothetical protein